MIDLDKIDFVLIKHSPRDDGFSWFIIDPDSGSSWRAKAVDLIPSNEVIYTELDNIKVMNPLKNIKNFKELCDEWTDFLVE